MSCLVYKGGFDFLPAGVCGETISQSGPKYSVCYSGRTGPR